MERGKYWILLILMLTTGGKRAIKRPTTLAHFSFLAPEREILVKIKASVETVQYSILVNFDDQNWSVMSEEMNMVFKHFEELPFFPTRCRISNHNDVSVGARFSKSKGNGIEYK
jgi:hypothetical protein